MSVTLSVTLILEKAPFSGLKLTSVQSRSGTSVVSIFQDITNLYISNALLCILGQSLVDYREVGNAR